MNMLSWKQENANTVDHGTVQWLGALTLHQGKNPGLIYSPRSSILGSSVSAVLHPEIQPTAHPIVL